MGFTSLLLIALSLATDCFAAAIARGTSLRRPSLTDTLAIGLVFGAFSVAMPMIGWAIGLSFRQFVTEIDHWIALFLLGGIGGHMIWEALHGEPMEAASEEPKRVIGWSLVGTAFATSLDAAAIGITFAFLEVNIVEAGLVIGGISCLFAIVGLYVARITGPLFGRKAEILGGLVLIAIGIKTAVEHTLEQGFLF